MIDLRRIWLPQIIRYAELVADETVLRSSWIDGDRSQTSVTDYDELYVQIFDGMDAKDQLVLAMDEFHDDPEILGLISNFIDELLELDKFVELGGINDQSARILASAEWSAVRKRARKLDLYAARRGYPREIAAEPLVQSSP